MDKPFEILTEGSSKNQIEIQRIVVARRPGQTTYMITIVTNLTNQFLTAIMSLKFRCKTESSNIKKNISKVPPQDFGLKGSNMQINIRLGSNRVYETGKPLAMSSCKSEDCLQTSLRRETLTTRKILSDRPATAGYGLAKQSYSFLFSFYSSLNFNQTFFCFLLHTCFIFPFVTLILVVCCILSRVLQHLWFPQLYLQTKPVFLYETSRGKQFNFKRG